eukprot:1367560-Amorphochlora_amoeboformis.AAC.2
MDTRMTTYPSTRGLVGAALVLAGILLVGPSISYDSTLAAPVGRMTNSVRRAVVQPHACNRVKRRQMAISGMTIATGALSTLISGRNANAISGGGKGYSGYTIEDEDFSGKNLAGEEFRGTMAKRVHSPTPCIQPEFGEIRYACRSQPQPPSSPTTTRTNLSIYPLFALKFG